MLLNLFLGCSQNLYPEGELWTGDLVASDGALYAQLPHARALARFDETDPATEVDLDGAEPIRLVATPDGARVLAFTRWATCDDSDPKIETTDDCLWEDRGYDYELAILGSDGVERTVQAPGHLQGVAFSPDASTAVLYLDGAPTEEIGGVADIDSVFFVNLESGETATATVGVAPGNILFTPDGARAVVLSRESAVVVDLATFEVLVRFDLTLDADQQIDPSAAVLSPDGTKALVAMSNLGVLYVLDLVDPSIDIQELPGRPVALATDEACDCTVIAYSNASQLDLLNPDGSIHELDLDVPVTQLVGYDGNVLAYGTGGAHDVYRVDLTTQVVTEYVVANPPVSVQVDDVGRFAVALMQPESTSGDEIDAYTDQRWGLSVLDLADDEPRNLMFDRMPMDYEVLTDDATTYALVLLEGENTVQLIDLADPLPTTEIHLEEAPLVAGSMGDGRFYITQDSTLGLVSILDPLAPEDIVEIGGFAAIGLYTDNDLPRRGEQ